MSKYPRGSEWRIWDLQVQTILDDRYESLSSYYEKLKDEDAGRWSKFVSSVMDEETALRYDSKAYFSDPAIPEKERCTNYCRNLFSFLEVYQPDLGLVGFTDHNYSHGSLLDEIASYSRSAKTKALIGVEINVGGIHMLVYFNRPPCQKTNFSDGIRAFLDSIGIQSAKSNGVLTLSTLSVEDVVKKIKSEGGLFIYPHCNSDNGLFQERTRTDRTHLFNLYNLEDTIFLQAASSSKMTATMSYVLGKPEFFKSEPIFSIASDSRSLVDIGCADSSGSYFWVKANPTFSGFRQVYIEPTRTIIADQPNLLKRVANAPNKFIKTLKVEKVPGTTIGDIWFDNFEVNFNSGLVAIVGKKGNGKSAVTDMLSLCGDTKQGENFSFLLDISFERKCR